MDLTPRLRKVLVQAEEEAGRLGHAHVGTEHVLLALLADVGGLAGKALRSAASADDIRRRLHELMSPVPAGDFPDHPRPWSSCIVRDVDGVPVKHGRWMKQYFIDRRGMPVRNSAGTLVHTELDDLGRPVFEPGGSLRLVEVPIGPGELGQNGEPL